MINDRPYKNARTHAQALAELREHAGTQFDPEVVNAFCAVYAAGVPPDGLEEVYKLHERARDGLERIDPRAAAAILQGTVPRRARRPSVAQAAAPPAAEARARRPRATKRASQDGTAAERAAKAPTPIQEATG